MSSSPHSNQPLDPEVTIDPFTTTSFTGPDNHTGLFLDADAVNSSVLIRTNDTDAIYIDKYQNIGINTIAPAAQLDVNAADGKCIQMTYNGTANTAALSLASDGKMTLSSTGTEVNVDSTSDFNIKSHNGTSTGLKLNDTLVRASADQINYNVVTAGTAAASKAVVLDSNRDVTNLRNVTASQLTGTLQTAAQPNVNSVNVLNVANHDGNQGLSLGGTLVTSTAAQLNYVNVTAGSGTASKAVVLDSSRNISNINNLTASQLTGSLQTASQTNITAVGTLLGLDIDGSLTGLSTLSVNTAVSGRTLVLNSDVGNCIQLCYDTASGTPETYVDMLVSSAGDLSVTASGGNVNITSHNGSTQGLKLGGTLVTASADQINYLQGTTTGSASGGKALIFDSSRNINNINNLTATQLTGTLQTAAQPNINSVNVLNIANHNGSTIGLSLNGTLVTATASEINYIDVTPGTAAASKALVLNSSSDISGINSLSATDLTGTLQTAAQPNVTSVGTLTSIATSGSLTLGETTISEGEIGVLDGVTAGTASASKALVLDGSSDISGINSLSATDLTGTLQTAAQTNITSVGTLDSIATSGDLTLGETTISEGEIGVLDGVTAGTASASKALVLDGSSDISGINSLSATDLTGTLQTAVQTNITSVGTLTSITTSGSLTLGSTAISESEIGVLDGVTAGTVTASKALVVDSNKDIASIRNLTASQLTGTLQTAAQPNITSVGTLTSIITSGSLTLGSTAISESEIGVLDGVTAGTASASKALVLNSSSNISGINSLSATDLTGTLQTASQPNVTSVSTLDIVDHDGSTQGLKLAGVLLTATAAQLNSVFGGGGGGGSGTFTDLTLNGNLDIVNADGSTTGLLLGGNLVTASANELNYLTGVTPGTASTDKALVVDSDLDISNINNLYVNNSVTIDGVTLTATEVNAIDGVSAGTAAANKALVLDSNSDISGINSIATDKLTLSGSTVTYFGTKQVATGSGSATALGGRTLSAYSPTLQMGITIATSDTSLDQYSIWNSPAGYSSYNTFSLNGQVPGSQAFNLSINWQPEASRFVMYYRASASGQSLIYYLISTNGINWTNPTYLGLSIEMGTNIVYHAPSGTYVMFSYDKFYYSTNGLNSWSSITLSNPLTTSSNANMDAVQIFGNYVTHRISRSGNNSNVVYWNGSAWSQAGIINESTFPLNRAYSVAEDRLYMLANAPNNTASAATVTIYYIDNFSSRAFSTWSSNIQSVGISNINPIGGSTSMYYYNNYDVILVGPKSSASDSTNYLKSIRILRIKNKQIIYDFTDGPTESPGTIYKVVYASATPMVTTDWDNNLIIQAINNTATVNSVYWTPTSISNGIAFGNTTITEDELAVVDSVILGTASASKAMVTDASNNIGGIGSLTATSIVGTNLTGTLQTAAQPNVTSVGTLTSITTSGTLTLGSTVISAAEIGVIDGVTAGTVTASKALVVDANKDIASIRNLTASQLTGTLQTAAQPNVTSVGTLTSITTSGSLTLGSTAISESEIGVLDGVTAGTASASKALVVDSNKDIISIRNLTASQLTGTLQTAAQPNVTSVGTLTSITTSGSLTLGSTAISESEIGVLDGVTAGTASASKALVLDGSSDISGINSLSATDLTGTLQTASQTNITSVGTLSSIATSGDLTLGETTISEGEIGVLDGVTAGTASASKALVLDGSSDISGINSLSATDLTGTLQTASQPNVTSVSVLDITSHDGSTVGLSLDGTLVTATANQLNYNVVTPGMASASKALVLDINSDISGINSLSADSLTGTLQTAAQPNVTSVGTLTSITTSGSLTLGSTAISESEIGVLDGVTAGTVTASKVLVVDSNKDIASIRNLTASQLTGTLQTAAQPNVTSVGTLTSIATSGSLTLGSTAISESEIGVLDGVTAGTVTASKVLVVDSNKDIASIRNLTASQLTGTLQTAAQPNVTSVGTLTSIATSGSLTLGETTISENEIGVLDGVTIGTASASKALVLDSSSDISGINSLSATDLTGTLQTASQPNVTSVSVLDITSHDGSTVGLSLDGTLVTATAVQLNYNVVTPGTALASKALVLDSSSDISGINSLSATDLTGTLQTASQPNVTSVSVLDITSHDGSTVGLSLDGTLVTATAAQLNYNVVTPGTASASKALIVDSNKDIISIRNLTASQLTGTLQTAAQPNVTSVGTLTSIATSGSLTLGSTAISESEIGVLDGVTAGTASASKALVVDSNKDIISIRNLTASQLTGTLQTAAQPNVTSVGTLTSITTSGSLTLGSTAISESEIGVLDGVTIGTAAASKALVLDSSSNIAGINSLSTAILAVGSPANTDLPVEIGYTTYQFTGAYAYNNNLNAHGLVDAAGGVSANYSLRADGRILVTGEVEITSDRRLKKDIEALTPDFCKSFISKTTPVRFNWRNDDAIPDYGYIAQDVLKAGFNDLVTVVPHPGMEGSEDSDGFINPTDAKFVFSPGKIIPMLALNQKQLFESNDAKDLEIASLTQRLADLETLVAQLIQKK